MLTIHNKGTLSLFQNALWSCYSIRCKYVSNLHTTKEIIAFRTVNCSPLSGTRKTTQSKACTQYNPSPPPSHLPKAPLLNRRPHNPIPPHNISRTNKDPPPPLLPLRHKPQRRNLRKRDAPQKHHHHSLDLTPCARKHMSRLNHLFLSLLELIKRSPLNVPDRVFEPLPAVCSGADVSGRGAFGEG